MPPRPGSGDSATRGGPDRALRRKADPDRWIELSTFPGASVRAPRPIGSETIVVMRDVTDARRREAIRETFVGVLSHELRTPVTTIYGGAKLLAREGSTLDEEVRRSVFEDITDEAERLHRLVEDVIALNRFGEDAGDIGARTGPPPAHPPARDHVRAEPLAGRDLPAEIEAGLPTVVADPTYVEQVVRNLLSNAAKYGGAGYDGRCRRSSQLTTRSWSGSSTTVRASRPRRRTACSSCSSARRRPPARPAAPGSGCSSAPA